MKKLTKIAALLAACLMLFTACSTEDSGSQSTGADTASLLTQRAETKAAIASLEEQIEEARAARSA